MLPQPLVLHHLPYNTDGVCFFGAESFQLLATVARDPAAGLGARELLGQERVIKPLAAGGEAVNLDHMSFS
jgi:hypothetical protein